MTISKLHNCELTHTMPQGLELMLDWYVANVG